MKTATKTEPRPALRWNDTTIGDRLVGPHELRRMLEDWNAYCRDLVIVQAHRHGLMITPNTAKRLGPTPCAKCSAKGADDEPIPVLMPAGMPACASDNQRLCPRCIRRPRKNGKPPVMVGAREAAAAIEDERAEAAAKNSDAASRCLEMAKAARIDELKRNQGDLPLGGGT